MDTRALRHRLHAASAIALAACLAACASQPKPIETVAAPATVEAQREAQSAALAEAAQSRPILKRKVAIGRVSNETVYGRSLLRDAHDDPLGKQVADMLSQKLVETGEFLVLERPDLARLEVESALSGESMTLVGVDTLIMGSLVEFGRSTTGTKGFWSKSKLQKATAGVALRLVDTSTGLVYFSASGAGEASTETGEVAFAGSTASYDGSLNDAAIANAVTDVVDEIVSSLTARPWHTVILQTDGGRIFLGGGRRQGIAPGMRFDVMTAGEKIKSSQTGFIVTLPGQRIATLEVDSTFGETETNEGAVAHLISGSISRHDIATLKVVEHERPGR